MQNESSYKKLKISQTILIFYWTYTLLNVNTYHYLATEKTASNWPKLPFKWTKMKLFWCCRNEFWELSFRQYETMKQNICPCFRKWEILSYRTQNESFYKSLNICSIQGNLYIKIFGGACYNSGLGIDFYSVKMKQFWCCWNELFKIAYFKMKI